MSIPANSLRPPKGPNLLVSPAEYNAGYQERLNNALRIYFNELDNTFQTLLANTPGGMYLRFPYGAFYDTTTQSAASTTTAYAITFDTSDITNEVSLSNSSRLNVTNPGVYNLQYSVQLNSDDTAPQDVDVWVRKNGTDVANSNSRFGLAARKGPGDPFHVIGAINLVIALQASDYIQLYWRTSSTSVTITAYAAGATPTRPAIPSVIATLTFVSALTT